MPDTPATVEEGFHRQLLASALLVRTLTSFGTRQILKDVRQFGGVRAAKDRLGETRTESDDPGEYFWATKQVGRMDLSIEAIVLDPKWAGLFAQDELDRAASRLSKHNFQPDMENPGTHRAPTVLVPTQKGLAETTTAGWTLGGQHVTFEPLGVYFEESPCEIVAEHAVARPIHVDAFVRKHLNECSRCRGTHLELDAAYEQIDLDAMRAWSEILDVFFKCLQPDLYYFIYADPSPDLPEHPNEIDIELELDRVRTLCEWRAFQVGLFLGQFMAAYSGSFGGKSDWWIAWRKAEASVPASEFLPTMPKALFTLALAARNLIHTRNWPAPEESFLWLPSYGDIDPVSDLIQVEKAPIYQWETILGPPPADFNSGLLLDLAGQAAIGLMHELEPASDLKGGEPAELRELVRQIHATVQDISGKQDAEILQTERMAAYMESSDRHSCEAELLELLPGVWGRLTAHARCQLIGAEQIRRTPGGHATPEKIIHSIATAFELQLKHTVLATLLEHLKKADVREIPTGADDRNSVFKPYWKAERYSLGTIKRLLEFAHPTIRECFERYHWNRDNILAALEVVTGARNPAAHGGAMSSCQADVIRDDWFHWQDRPGGIFSVLFPHDVLTR